MKKISLPATLPAVLPTFIVALSIGLGGCALMTPTQLPPGTSEQEVVARLGQPTHQYRAGNDELFEYMNGPYGQTTYMARFGPDKRLISYQQVLNSATFATIVPGKTNKRDVLLTIGAPSRTVFLTLSQLEVWSYPYREANVWDSIMHVHFDRNGVVQRMENGPDPRRTPDLNIPF
jgi:outer membrane protein assembly factor BamE (lipoprotein component of BamABCDE complex)